ncbi:MAG: ABC transporter permease [Firmicutes bacterium]|nr:ABC transporter permease [Bacillota bacterium]MCL5040103.1 ABC transporter permease [Bacillota bacterium]
MRLSDLTHLAFQGISRNPLRSILTILGITVGISSVIALTAIAEGVKTYISLQVQDLGVNLIIVSPDYALGGAATGSFGTVSTLTEDDYYRIAGASSVKMIAPIIENSGRMRAHGRETISAVNGTNSQYPLVRSHAVQRGRFLQEGDLEWKNRVVVIGSTVARLIFPDGEPLGQRLLINDEKFQVIGVMQEKGRTWTIDNDNRVFIPLTVAEDVYRTNKIGLIFAQARSAEGMEKAVEEIRQILLRYHKPDEFTVSRQRDIVFAFDGITRTLEAMLTGIGSISLIVGGIGIMNIMLVSVMERTREIGLRKALGASQRIIWQQFLLEAILLSLLGGGLGTLAGLAASRYIPRLIPYLPAVVSGKSVLLAIGISVTVGIFFGVYPAYKAARLDPIQGLRYE